MSEKLTRRPDLDRPPIKLPVNDMMLPQSVAFEDENGGIVLMSKEMVNALGIYGQVKRLTYMKSVNYRKVVMRDFYAKLKEGEDEGTPTNS